MDFKEIIKAHVISQALNVGRFNKNTVKYLLLMQLIDKGFNIIPHVFKYIKSFNSSNSSVEITDNETKSIQVKYTLDKDNMIDPMIMSILSKITKVETIKNLIYNGEYILPLVDEEIFINSNIFFKLTDVSYNENNKLESLSFVIYSKEHSIVELREFLQKCKTDYTLEIQNKLGDDLYFFDQITMKKTNSIMNNRLPFILFQKNKFKTNRNFDNIFFEQKNELLERINTFRNNKEWYNKKGIPHTLGLLFYGHPGCGKTSTIKAIANVMNRHIINVHLSEIKTKTQLRQLFFDDDIILKDFKKIREENETIKIPVDKRLYVIEDIDSMEIIKKRNVETTSKIKKEENDNSTFISSITGQEISLMSEPSRSRNETDNDIDLDLSTLLNLLDGTLEMSDRIIIITTNYPEIIDEAFIRPGRIDMFIEFQKASANIIAEMYTNFYETNIPKSTKNKFTDYKFTPAEIYQLLFKNYKNSKKFLNDIINKSPDELFKYSHLKKNY